MSGSPEPPRHSRTIRSSLLQRLEKQDARLPQKMATPLTPQNHDMITHKELDLASAKATASSEDAFTPASFKALPQAPGSRRSQSPSVSSSTSNMSLNTSILSTTTESERNFAQIMEDVGENYPDTLPTRLPSLLDASASPPPLLIPKYSTSPPAASVPPLRVIEDDDHPLRAAILRNAAFLFPEYTFDQLSIATGMMPSDAFTQQNAFALVFASHLASQHGSSGKPQRVVRELAKSQMGCTSRRRALESLLMVCEFAVGAKVVGSRAHETYRTGVTGGGDAVPHSNRHLVTGDGPAMSADGAAGRRNGLKRAGSKVPSLAESAPY